MTTHQQEAPSGSYDESPTSATPPVSNETAPVMSSPSSEPSAPSAEPSAPSAEPSAPSAEPSPGVDAPRAAAQQQSSAEHESSTAQLLFADDDLAEMRGRWAAVQAAFVDDPKDCVQKADVLVSDLVDQLTTGFAHARSHLEEQWGRGEEASTEDLRVALMHYREFFERLLAV
jgi:hypothetical protein